MFEYSSKFKTFHNHLIFGISNESILPHFLRDYTSTLPSSIPINYPSKMKLDAYLKNHSDERFPASNWNEILYEWGFNCKNSFEKCQSFALLWKFFSNNQDQDSGSPLQIFPLNIANHQIGDYIPPTKIIAVLCSLCPQPGVSVSFCFLTFEFSSIDDIFGNWHKFFFGWIFSN